MDHAGLLAFYGFMTATLQLPEVAFRIYCIQLLGFTPATYAMVASTSVIPWSIKPLWGFLIDNLNYRRLAIMGCSVGFVCCWCTLGFAVNETPAALAAATSLSSFFLCFMDVMADADLVTRVRRESDEDVGVLQSHVWTSRAVGSLVAAIVGGLLARTVSVYSVFLISSVLIMPGAVGLAWAIQPRRPALCSETISKIRLLGTTLATRKIYRPCVFIFVMSAIPTCYFALVVFMQTSLHFTPMEFAYIDAASHGAHIFGATMFRKRLRHLSFQTIFYVGIFTLVALRCLQLLLITRTNIKMHIPDLAFAMAEDVAFSIVGQVLIMPVCVLGARLCPRGIEGALYSTLMSVSNFGGLVASWTGAALSDAFGITSTAFGDLWKLSILCTALSVIPVFFVPFMPRTAPAALPCTPGSTRCADTPTAECTGCKTGDRKAGGAPCASV